MIYTSKTSYKVNVYLRLSCIMIMYIIRNDVIINNPFRNAGPSCVNSLCTAVEITRNHGHRYRRRCRKMLGNRAESTFGGPLTWAFVTQGPTNSIKIFSIWHGKPCQIHEHQQWPISYVERKPVQDLRVHRPKSTSIFSRYFLHHL